MARLPVFRSAFAVLPFLFVLSQNLAAQTDSSAYNVFSGRIIDDSLGFALPSVHVWNESTRMGSISDATGEFSLHVRSHDTIVFSTIGYESHVVVVPAPWNEQSVIRLKPRTYGIDELVVRRFRSYESFKYHVIHLDLPEPAEAQTRNNIKVSSLAAALDGEQERVEKEKLESGRFGYITPLGKGINREKEFKDKMRARQRREQVIHSKFNRTLVRDLTHLEGDELTEFIAMCNFSEEYLFETDLPTIIEDMYAILDDYQSIRDTIPADTLR